MPKMSLTQELEQDLAKEREEDMDDAEWDRWMALSEEEQDAEIEAIGNGYREAVARLTLAQEYAMHRRSRLKSCLRLRRLIARMNGMDFAVRLLKDAQKSLLKLRAWRVTGVYAEMQ